MNSLGDNNLHADIAKTVFVGTNDSSFKTCSSNDLPPSETPRTRSRNTAVGLANDLSSVTNSAAKRKYSIKDLLPKPAPCEQKSGLVLKNIKKESVKNSTKRKREDEHENYDEEEEEEEEEEGDTQEQAYNIYDTADLADCYNFVNSDTRPYYETLNQESCRSFGHAISFSGKVVVMPKQTITQREKLRKALTVWVRQKPPAVHSR
jgi:hypothetical protein